MQALRAQADQPVDLPTLGLCAGQRLVRPAAGASDPVALRRRYGAVARRVAGERLAVSADAALDRAQHLLAVIGLAQGGYAFRRYKPQPGPRRIDCCGPWPGGRALLKQAQIIIDALELCRDLINTPAADLGPAEFVRAARAACAGTGISLHVHNAAACRRLGMGALLAVGAASHRAARLLELRYPARPGPQPWLALCGKGVCFDTGGLDLKPSKAMSLMRKDMGGAATVLAAVVAHARLGGQRPLRAYLPLVDNAVGPRAFRPGDVLRAADGTTIEVGNTDAEGRLVLADAIVQARRDGAAQVLSVATLTGAALAALGRIHVPVMGADALVEPLLAGGRVSGEQLWRLPLDEQHAAIMRGTTTDLRNEGNGEAGCITAAAFLRHFAGTVPFAHADISPTSWMPTDHDLGPAGATGVLVTSLLHVLGSWPV